MSDTQHVLTVNSDNPNQGPDYAADPAAPLPAEVRSALIQKLQRDALAETSPVLANLQLTGGDLLEMSLAMKEAIAAAMASRPDISQVQELLPFFDTYLKLCRQGDRFLRLKFDIGRSTTKNHQHFSGGSPDR